MSSHEAHYKPPVKLQSLQEKAQIWQEGYRAARRDLGTYYYGKPNPTTPNPYKEETHVNTK